MPLSPEDTHRSRGRRLLARHIRAHWESQQAFAEAVGIHPQTLSRYLTGRLRPNLDNAALLEKVSAKTGEPVVSCVAWTES